MKITLVHDYLNQLGGAERVVAILHEMYPQAPIHTLFVDRAKLWPQLEDAQIIPTFLQRFPFVKKHFKLFFWLYPFVIKNINVEDSDLVISSSSAYAKGIRLTSGRLRRSSNRPLHICYCHAPMRFAWDFDNYMENETDNRFLVKTARLVVPFLKRWDKKSADNVDLFIANSVTVQRRIKDLYKRDSAVIHPPVEICNRYISKEATGDYFLMVSRLVSYKRLDVAIRACNDLNVPLKVVGRGPDRVRLENLAGPTIEFLGFLSETESVRAMASCKALILPGEEDFGITTVEVNLLGRPVIAFRGGGALETITEGVNGIFFEEQNEGSLMKAIQQFDTCQWEPHRIQLVATQFERSVFEDSFRDFISKALAQRVRVPEHLVFATGERVTE